jgi:ubiquinone/menaquinone biosynthesis C-methylase UbiE
MISGRAARAPEEIRRSVLTVSNQLESFYDGYYSQSGDLETKRRISARDSVDHMRDLAGDDLGHVIDVGAGNGSVMAEITSRGMARSISALEISATGLDEISKLDLPNVRSVKNFDGYRMPFDDDDFDTALCVHVLEHVEHERLFLRELGRIAKRVFIEVPLEGGLRGRVNRTYGHINYYQPAYLLNLLETSGMKVVGSRVFTSSRAYETFCYGKLKGTAKNMMRRSLLKVAGKRIAPSMLTYLMAVVCEKEAIVADYASSGAS